MIAKLFKRALPPLFYSPSQSNHLLKLRFLSQPSLRNFVNDQVEDPKNVSKHSSKDLAKNQQNTVAMWEEAQANKKNALILQDKQQIEQYVLSMVRGYFRTTQKGFLSLESNLTDHGLDSMDVVELVMQVQDDLGFIIDAENLTRFEKPKHFVNYIVQLEAYKKEFHRLPYQQTVLDTSLEGNFDIISGVKNLLNKKKKK